MYTYFNIIINMFLDFISANAFVVHRIYQNRNLVEVTRV